MIKKKPINVISVYNYISDCCKVSAKKTPVVRSKEYIKDGKYSECGLGKWYCTQCMKKCKVTRKTKETKENEQSEQ